MITHKPSTTIVYQTTDYSLFSFLKGNRAINKKKCDKIIEEIKRGNNMLPYVPIQVRVEDGKLKIFDGQHRFFVAQKINEPVYYTIVLEQKSMLDIARINTNMEKWTTANFINCYTTAGINDYVILNEFMEKFGFSLGICLYLLSEGNPGKATGSQPELYQEFAEGKFKVAQLDVANSFGEIVKQFSEFKNWRSRSFVLAIYRIIKAEKVPIEEVIDGFKRYPGMLKEEATWKDYIMDLEKIMNVGRKIRVVIS
jgi:hypothetical protein